MRSEDRVYTRAVQVESAPAAVRRRRALSCRRRRSGGSRSPPSAMLVLIVATGATVRLTGSGLGCPHWPTCTATHAAAARLPLRHRVLEPRHLGLHRDRDAAARASAPGARSASAAARSWLATGVVRRHARAGAARRDHRLLRPQPVPRDLAPPALADRARARRARRCSRRRGSSAAVAARYRALARAGGAALLARSRCSSSSGTLSTAAGRFPGSSGSTVVAAARLFYSAVYWHVRAVAVFGIVFLALAGWAWTRRERFLWLLRGCAGLLAILLAQMGIGELQYRTYGTCRGGSSSSTSPSPPRSSRWTVGLVARLWRPVAADWPT